MFWPLQLNSEIFESPEGLPSPNFGSVSFILTLPLSRVVTLGLMYNKYYLKHTTTVNHKSTFVMATKDFILNTIEKKVKKDSMET